MWSRYRFVLPTIHSIEDVVETDNIKARVSIRVYEIRNMYYIKLIVATIELEKLPITSNFINDPCGMYTFYLVVEPFTYEIITFLEAKLGIKLIFGSLEECKEYAKKYILLKLVARSNIDPIVKQYILNELSKL